jgi:hypothetical protein
MRAAGHFVQRQLSTTADWASAVIMAVTAAATFVGCQVALSVQQVLESCWLLRQCMP